MSGDYNGDEKVRINRINVESITDNKVFIDKLREKRVLFASPQFLT